MRGSGISWYRNTRCSLGDSGTEPHEPLAAPARAAVPAAAAAGAGGPLVPRGRREPRVPRGAQPLTHLTSGLRSFPFGWKMGKQYFVSVEVLYIWGVIFWGRMWGSCHIHKGRGEESCKSPLRGLRAAPWGQRPQGLGGSRSLGRSGKHGLVGTNLGRFLCTEGSSRNETPEPFWRATGRRPGGGRSRRLLHSEVGPHLAGSLSDLSSQRRSATSTNGHSQAFSRVIYPCLNVCKISSDDTFSYELAGLADTNQELNTIFSKRIKSPSNMQHAETLRVITLKYQKLEECQLLPSDGNNNDTGRNN